MTEMINLPTRLPKIDWKKLGETFRAAKISPELLKQYGVTDNQYHNLCTSQANRPSYELCEKMYAAAIDRLTYEEIKGCIIEQ